MWLASLPSFAEPYLVRPVSARGTYLGESLSMNDDVFLVPVFEKKTSKLGPNFQAEFGLKIVANS